MKVFFVNLLKSAYICGKKKDYELQGFMESACSVV